MGFKKILVGEPMPDKDDPKYKERHDKDVAAGKSFAKALRLDKAAAYVQRFATRHKELFLVLVFTFVLFSVGFNLWRMSNAMQHQQPSSSSAVDRQEMLLHLKRHHQQQNKERHVDEDKQSGDVQEKTTNNDLFSKIMI